MKNILRRFTKRRDAQRCDLLTADHIDALVDGRLAPERMHRFLEHRRRGCAECLHLAKAADDFRRVLAEGTLTAERAQFARRERVMRARLRHEAQLATAGRGTAGAWMRGLTLGELTQIAAAGRSEVVGSGGDFRSPEEGGGASLDPETDSADPTLGDGAGSGSLDRD